MFKRILFLISTFLAVQSCMHAAAYASFSEKIVALAYKNDFNAIRKLTMKHGIDSIDYRHNTLLHYAAQRGLYRLVNFLIRNGANVNAQNNDLDTPLHFAAVQGNTKGIRFLLTAGADPRLTNLQGETAFNLAQKSNNSHAASLCAVSSDDQSPHPTSIAPWEDQQSFSQQQEQTYHQEQWNALKRAQLAAQLDAAVFSGDLATVGLLVANNVPVSFRGPYGNTVLHTALLTPINPDSDAIFDLLLGQEEVLLDAQNLRGETPLHLAALTVNQKAFHALIAAGANPDLFNRDGKTALTLWEELTCKESTIDQAPAADVDASPGATPHSSPTPSRAPSPSPSPSDSTIVEPLERFPTPPYLRAARGSSQKSTASSASSSSPSKPVASLSWYEQSLLSEEEEEENSWAAQTLREHALQEKQSAPKASSNATSSSSASSIDSELIPADSQQEYIERFSYLKKLQKKKYHCCTTSILAIHLVRTFEKMTRPCALPKFFERMNEISCGLFAQHAGVFDLAREIIQKRQAVQAELMKISRVPITCENAQLILRSAWVQLQKDPSQVQRIWQQAHHSSAKDLLSAPHALIKALFLNYCGAHDIIFLSPEKPVQKDKKIKSHSIRTVKSPPPHDQQNTHQKEPRIAHSQVASSMEKRLPVIALVAACKKIDDLPAAVAEYNKKYTMHITPESMRYKLAEAVVMNRERLRSKITFETKPPKAVEAIIYIGLYELEMRKEKPGTIIHCACNLAKHCKSQYAVPFVYTILKKFCTEHIDALESTERETEHLLEEVS